MMEFKIEGNYFNKSKCFPGLNDLIGQAEKTPFAYNNTKKRFEKITRIAINRGLRGWSTTNQVQIKYVFGEPVKGKKRDYSNIRAAAEKIIEDALVKSKTLADDDPKHVAPSECEFVYTKGKPFIRVYIYEKGVDY